MLKKQHSHPVPNMLALLYKKNNKYKGLNLFNMFLVFCDILTPTVFVKQNQVEQSQGHC